MPTIRSRSKPHTTTATGRRCVPFLALARVQGLGHFSSVQPCHTDGQLLLSLKRRDVRRRGGRTSHLPTDDGRPNILLLFLITHSSTIGRLCAAPRSGGMFDTNSVRTEGKSVYIFGAYTRLRTGRTVRETIRTNVNECDH